MPGDGDFNQPRLGKLSIEDDTGIETVGVDDVSLRKGQTYHNFPPTDEKGIVSYSNKQHGNHVTRDRLRAGKRKERFERIVRLRNDWISGKYQSKADLADAYGMSVASANRYLKMSQTEVEKIKNLKERRKRKTDMADYMNIVYKMLIAISTPVSSGFVEGGNCRYKATKRLLFGRSGINHLFSKTYATSIIMRTGKSARELINNWIDSFKTSSRPSVSSVYGVLPARRGRLS